MIPEVTVTNLKRISYSIVDYIIIVFIKIMIMIIILKNIGNMCMNFYIKIKR